MEGLIITGPYRFIRHPQYLAMMLIVTVTTARAFVLGSITRGISWTPPENMLYIWAVIFGAYIAIAGIEEAYLAREYGTQYSEYLRASGFFVPMYRYHNRAVDLFVSVVFFVLLLYVSIAAELWSFGML